MMAKTKQPRIPNAIATANTVFQPKDLAIIPKASPETVVLA